MPPGQCGVRRGIDFISEARLPTIVAPQDPVRFGRPDASSESERWAATVKQAAPGGNLEMALSSVSMAALAAHTVARSVCGGLCACIPVDILNLLVHLCHAG